MSGRTWLGRACLRSTGTPNRHMKTFRRSITNSAHALYPRVKTGSRLQSQLSSFGDYDIVLPPEDLSSHNESSHALSRSTRHVPDNIARPQYALTGHPESCRTPQLKTAQDLTSMRRVGQVAKKVMDYAERSIRPGMTTDHLDALVHNEIIKHGAYPSPLLYRGQVAQTLFDPKVTMNLTQISLRFPKSICTSVNNIVCHGVPDK
jgi:methionyl aminopeptidase